MIGIVIKIVHVGIKFNMSQGAVTKRWHRLIENIVNRDM